MIEFWRRNRRKFGWTWCVLRRHNAFVTKDLRAGCNDCGYKMEYRDGQWVDVNARTR